jgi:hypothetical protein
MTPAGVAGGGADGLRSVLASQYADEPFVTVLPKGQLPQTRHVKGSNHCFIQASAHDDVVAPPKKGKRGEGFIRAVFTSSDVMESGGPSRAQGARCTVLPLRRAVFTSSDVMESGGPSRAQGARCTVLPLRRAGGGGGVRGAVVQGNSPRGARGWRGG